MSTLAEKVEDSLSRLVALRDQGLIDPELESHLTSMMDRTRTGRLFGHGSAVDFPDHIIKFAETCEELVQVDQNNAEMIKESVNKKFAGHRMRKPTELNRAIDSITREISSGHLPTVAPQAKWDFWWLPKFLKRR